MMTCLPTSGPAGSSRRARSGSRCSAQYRHSFGAYDANSGTADSRAAQRFLRVVGGERRHQVDDVEDLGRDAELGGRHVAHHLGAPGGLAGTGPRRSSAASRAAAAGPPLRRLRGRCRAARCVFGCGEVERLAVAVRRVHQFDQRIDHVVDRDDVGATGVGQHDRGERRQHGQLRQDAEEVVRARRPCPSRRCANRRRPPRAGRPGSAARAPTAPAVRPRTWSGDTASADPGRRRSPPRCTRRGRCLPPRSTTRGAASRPSRRASSITARVPSTLAARCASSSAVMS